MKDSNEYNFEPLSEYDDPVKAALWESYWEGFKQGRNVEGMKRVNYSTAKSKFERMWEREDLDV